MSSGRFDFDTILEIISTVMDMIYMPFVGLVLAISVLHVSRREAIMVWFAFSCLGIIYSRVLDVIERLRQMERARLSVDDYTHSRLERIERNLGVGTNSRRDG